MARYLSPEEVKAEHLTLMGTALGEVFHALHNELVWVFDKWREYTALFATSEERIDLLNASAARFFGFLQHALWEDVLLHLSRLTDPPESVRKPNLTLRRLPDLIADAALKARVEQLVSDVLHKTEFARDWRKRYLAHRDLPLALDKGAAPLAPASERQVVEAMEAMAAALNAVHEHFVKFEIRFTVPGGPGDALDLLHLLRDGLAARTAREARFERGVPNEDDLRLDQPL